MAVRPAISLVSLLLLTTLIVVGCGKKDEREWKGVPSSLPPVDALEPNGTSQYRIEPTHRGVMPSGTSVAGDMELVWKTDPLAIGIYTASKSSPAVDDALVYVGNDDGKLYAIDRASGEVAWDYPTRMWEREQSREGEKHRGIHGAPAFDDERVYIGDYDGWMYALEKTNGNLVWESEIGHSIGASPVLYDGYIFVSVEYGTPDGKVYILKAETGETASATPYLGNHPHSSTTLDVSRGYMLVGANNGIFFCFDFVNAREVWRAQTGGDIKSTAAVADSIAYITSWDQSLHAFNIETGETVFTFETKERSMSSPSVDDDTVYVGSHDGSLYAVNRQTGELRWSYATGGSVQASPTVIPDSNLVAIGSRGNYIHLIDRTDGTPRWSYNLGADMTSVPVVAGPSLFVFDDRGTLWRFDERGAQ